jgi:hypothetical protein
MGKILSKDYGADRSLKLDSQNPHDEIVHYLNQIVYNIEKFKETRNRNVNCITSLISTSIREKGNIAMTGHKCFENALMRDLFGIHNTIMSYIEIRPEEELETHFGDISTVIKRQGQLTVNLIQYYLVLSAHSSVDHDLTTTNLTLEPLDESETSLEIKIPETNYIQLYDSVFDGSETNLDSEISSIVKRQDILMSKILGKNEAQVAFDKYISCIHDLIYDGYDIPFWKSILKNRHNRNETLSTMQSNLLKLHDDCSDLIKSNLTDMDARVLLIQRQQILISNYATRFKSNPFSELPKSENNISTDRDETASDIYERQRQIMNDLANSNEVENEDEDDDEDDEDDEDNEDDEDDEDDKDDKDDKDDEDNEDNDPVQKAMNEAINRILYSLRTPKDGNVKQQLTAYHLFLNEISSGTEVDDYTREARSFIVQLISALTGSKKGKKLPKLRKSNQIAVYHDMNYILHFDQIMRRQGTNRDMEKALQMARRIETDAEKWNIRPYVLDELRVHRFYRLYILSQLTSVSQPDIQRAMNDAADSIIFELKGHEVHEHGRNLTAYSQTLEKFSGQIDKAYMSDAKQFIDLLLQKMRTGVNHGQLQPTLTDLDKISGLNDILSQYKKQLEYFDKGLEKPDDKLIILLRDARSCEENAVNLDSSGKEALHQLRVHCFRRLYLLSQLIPLSPSAPADPTQSYTPISTQSRQPYPTGAAMNAAADYIVTKLTKDTDKCIQKLTAYKQYIQQTYGTNTEMQKYTNEAVVFIDLLLNKISNPKQVNQLASVPQLNYIKTKSQNRHLGRAKKCLSEIEQTFKNMSSLAFPDATLQELELSLKNAIDHETNATSLNTDEENSLFFLRVNRFYFIFRLSQLVLPSASANANPDNPLKVTIESARKPAPNRSAETNSEPVPMPVSVADALSTPLLDLQVGPTVPVKRHPVVILGPNGPYRNPAPPVPLTPPPATGPSRWAEQIQREFDKRVSARCYVLPDIRGSFETLVRCLARNIANYQSETGLWTWLAPARTTVVLPGMYIHDPRVERLTTYECNLEDTRIIEALVALHQLALKNDCFVVALVGPIELLHLLKPAEQIPYAKNEYDALVRREFIEHILWPFLVQQGLLVAWADYIIVSGGLEYAWFDRHRTDFPCSTIREFNSTFQRRLRAQQWNGLAPLLEPDSPVFSRRMYEEPRGWLFHDAPLLRQQILTFLTPKVLIGGDPDAGTFGLRNRLLSPLFHAPKVDPKSVFLALSEDHASKDWIYILYHRPSDVPKARPGWSGNPGQHQTPCQLLGIKLTFNVQGTLLFHDVQVLNA